MASLVIFQLLGALFDQFPHSFGAHLVVLLDSVQGSLVGLLPIAAISRSAVSVLNAVPGIVLGLDGGCHDADQNKEDACSRKLHDFFSATISTCTRVDRVFVSFMTARTLVIQD